MIALNHVGVRAGAFTLTDITFTIPSGAFGVVVGAAGSGKTTMLEVIADVRTVTSGTIALHQHSVTEWPPEKRGVGLVYQPGALFPHSGVADNIGWSGQSEALRKPIVDRLGIAALFNTPITELSGGERQLVALARALVRVRSCLDRSESAVLLLNEPFSALDPRRRLATRETVREFHRDWQLTTLMVTHDSVEARRADSAILLDAGRVVQSGNPRQMLRQPLRADVKLFLEDFLISAHSLQS